MIHGNSATALKCKNKHLFDEKEKSILFLPVIDGNLYGSLQIHESFKRIKKDKAPYITVKIYNASSEPYYLRKGTLTYNEFVVTPLESKIKALHILEPNMKVRKTKFRKLRLGTKLRFKTFISRQTKYCKANVKLSEKKFFPEVLVIFLT